ncbi:MAG: 4-hydroxyphenylacetate 3-hydroxylase family protein [Anaerolineae bacterium]|nr:4-hydroxyphenylacetate 3-hydroxylase family protein [Anaerolineae bacterium]
MMKTREEYIESIRKLNPEVYMFGQRVTNIVDNPVVRPSLNAVAATYELAQGEIMTATSHLSGRRINRFTHIHQSTDDLVRKSKMERLMGAYTGTCFQRCAGMDALNTLSVVTYNIDQKHGTPYYQRFLKYLRYVQDEDLVCDAAMTDAKGDRRLRPAQQADPDMYTHVVREVDGGIIVRGAKLHQTGALNSHEIIVVPTRAMREGDRDYAVSFALPSDTKGIIYIYGRQPGDTRKLEGATLDIGNLYYGGHECLVVFDDVFVPWERVFMYREYEFAQELVEKFASYHRQSYACKAGMGDVLIGATQTIAEYNGIADAPHVRDKIVEMNHLNETIFCCSLACAYEGAAEPSGTYYVNPLMANITKLHVTRVPYELAKMSQEIAGGAVVTVPSEKDLRHPEVGRWVKKYMKGVAEVSAEDRIRVLRLIESLTMGLGAACYLPESMHGAGSPQAQKIMIARQTNLRNKQKAACRLCGITT